MDNRTNGDARTPSATPRRRAGKRPVSVWVDERPRRRFTLESARRTLPLVSRIAADVVGAHARASAIHRALPRAGSDRGRLEIELRGAADTLARYVDELADLGVELRDCASGTVEFASLRDGREIVLSWRPGDLTIEDAIR